MPQFLGCNALIVVQSCSALDAAQLQKGPGLDVLCSVLVCSMLTGICLQF